MDGILTPEWIVLWFLVAAVFIAVGARKIVKKRKENPAFMSILALMGAAVFIISVWHLPVAVGGSSGHPTGTALAAIVIGPFATVVVTSIALFFQMFLAHGGITTLGANTVSMGIVGAFTGYAVYLALRKLGASFWLSAGIAGLVGDLLTYVTTALQLALSLHPESVLSNWALFTAEFSIVQIPISILEFAFTAATIQYILNHRPEMLKWWHKQDAPIPVPQLQEPVRHGKNRVDKFTKYALITMFAIVAGMLISTYVGYSIYGNSIFETRYITVIEEQARNLGLVFGHVIELAETGEYVGFALAGIISGFVIGYLLPSVFGRKRET
jgi:cobalt/nickel transport system permease protein